MEDIKTPSVEPENVNLSNGRIYRKLLRHIFDIASKANDGISTNEYDLLIDTINGLTTSMIAKERGLSYDIVYKQTRKAFDKLDKIVNREVTNLRLPVRVAKCLIENNVKTIFDLVSLSESEIRQINGLTTEDADTIINRIVKIKFKPGMKFRWDELHKLYYLEDK